MSFPFPTHFPVFASVPAFTVEVGRMRGSLHSVTRSNQASITQIMPDLGRARTGRPSPGFAIIHHDDHNPGPPSLTDDPITIMLRYSKEIQIRTDGFDPPHSSLSFSLTTFQTPSVSRVVLNAWCKLRFCVPPRDTLGVRDVR